MVLKAVVLMVDGGAGTGFATGVATHGGAVTSSAKGVAMHGWAAMRGGSRATGLWRQRSREVA